MVRSEKFRKVEAALSQAQDLSQYKGQKLLIEGVWPVIDEMARNGHLTEADDLRIRAAMVARNLHESTMYVKEGPSAIHARQ